MEVGNIRPGAELYAVTANTARNLGRLFIGRASDVYFRWVRISVDGGMGGRDGGGGAVYCVDVQFQEELHAATALTPRQSSER